MASNEEDFDAKLRENFILVLILGVCFLVCGAFLARRLFRRDDVEEPLLSTALSAVSLTFALSLVFVVPIDQLLRAFPGAVRWFGIDGVRFAKKLANVCFMGNTLAMFLLNPFGFLFSEANDGTWRSFWTTMLELLLLLVMILSLGMLFFTRSTINDMLFDPSRVILKLVSLLMHIPGCLGILYLAPNALLNPVKRSLNLFVPWRQNLVSHEATVLKQELQMMQEWSHKRRGSGIQADVADLQKEIERLETSISRFPILQNLVALSCLAISFALVSLVGLRMIVPENFLWVFLLDNPKLMCVLVPMFFQYNICRAFCNNSRVASFFSINIKRAESTSSNKTGKMSLKHSPQLVRTDSNASLGSTDDSLSLASFVALALVFASSTSLVLTGIFHLQLSFPLPCHPFLLHDFIVVPYCGILIAQLVRGIRRVFSELFVGPQKSGKLD